MQINKTPLWSLALVCATATGSEQQTEIETIVVTSQRIERPLHEVPSNLTYVDATTIDNLGLRDLDQLVALAPNVYMQTLDGDFDYIQMRGMPRNLEQSTVGLYIDGVPYNNLYGLNLDLLNIDSVELLRGPQANLFGRNSRDGVISINSKPVAEQSQFKVDLGMGQYRQRELRAGLSTPLVDDQLGLNVGASWLRRDGVVENTLLGDELDEVDQYTLRGSLLWTPDDKSQIRLSFDHAKRDNGSYPYVNASPTLGSGDDLQAALDTDNRFELESSTLSLHISRQLDSGWQLSSISSWSHTEVFGRFDADFSALPFGHFDTWLDDRDIYQEFRLATEPGRGNMDWLFGLSYSLNKDDNRNDYALFGSGAEGQLRQEGIVAYGDMVWRFAPSWQLQAGLRWLDQEFTGDTVFINPLLPLPQAQTSGRHQNSDQRWLSKASISKFIDPRQSLFLSYGQGYLPGAGTWIAEATDENGLRQGAGVNYAPELSKTLELGYKLQVPRWKAVADITLFQSEIEDYQHSYADALGLSRIASVDKVRSRGIEASWSMRINQFLDWMLSFGYNDAEIDQIDGITGATALTGIEPGARIPNAPKSNVHSHITYQQAVNPDWNLLASLSWDRYGDTVFDFSGNTSQGAYNLINASLLLEHRDNWRLELWGKNLTDRRYQQYRVQLPGVDVANYGMPRQIGLRLSKTF